VNNPRDLNLADFFDGHDRDPLRAPEAFTAWRAASPREQALFRRPALGPTGPRTMVQTEHGPREVLNLASLDYLGLNRHPVVAHAISLAVSQWGSGACGVPMLTGTTALHEALERDVAELCHQDAAALFTSGFAGGTGLMAALLRRGDVAVADEKAHMCWMDGVRQSGARLATFAHDNPEDLDRVLSLHRERRRLVVVDGLYSMDGDVADLPGLLDVCEVHGVGLIVDEAHSIFALGERGGGVVEQQGVRDRVRLQFGTFSKALSQVGAFAAAGSALVEYARMYAHPFVFSAAMPPAQVAGIRAAMQVLRDEPDHRRTLADNTAYYRAQLRGLGLDLGPGDTHVVPIIVGDARELLFDAALAMLERGLYVVPIDYPAVPEDGLRFRTAVTAAHARADLDEALNIIEDCVARPLRNG
jgi:glycine C-acetyltransferase